MSYLLDTNTCVECLRHRNAAIIARVASTSPSEIYLCSVVKAELFYGAHRSQHVQRNLDKVEDFVRPYHSHPFDDDAARAYGRIRTDLERRGLVIGPNDLLIASIALVHGLTLVTHNTSEFRNVDGLSLEDWHGTA